MLLTSKSRRCKPSKVAVRERATYAWQEPQLTHETAYAVVLIFRGKRSQHCQLLVSEVYFGIGLLNLDVHTPFTRGNDSPVRRPRLNLPRSRIALGSAFRVPPKNTVDETAAVLHSDGHNHPIVRWPTVQCLELDNYLWRHVGANKACVPRHAFL